MSASSSSFSPPRKFLRSIAAALSIALGAAVGTTAALGTAGTAQAQVGPGWHILVYAVNDSSSDLPLGFDIDEMVAASRSGITFTVYADSSDQGEYPASQFAGNTAEAVIIEVAAGTVTVTDRLAATISSMSKPSGRSLEESFTAYTRMCQPGPTWA